MIIYNVHYQDYKNKEMIGALVERRKDPRRGSTLIGFEVGENRIWAIRQGCKCYFY